MANCSSKREIFFKRSSSRCFNQNSYRSFNFSRQRTCNLLCSYLSSRNFTSILFIWSINSLLMSLELREFLARVIASACSCQSCSCNLLLIEQQFSFYTFTAQRPSCSYLILMDCSEFLCFYLVSMSYKSYKSAVIPFMWVSCLLVRVQNLPTDADSSLSSATFALAYDSASVLLLSSSNFYFLSYCNSSSYFSTFLLRDSSNSVICSRRYRDYLSDSANKFTIFQFYEVRVRLSEERWACFLFKSSSSFAIIWLLPYSPFLRQSRLWIQDYCCTNLSLRVMRVLFVYYQFLMRLAYRSLEQSISITLSAYNFLTIDVRLLIQPSRVVCYMLQLDLVFSKAIFSFSELRQTDSNLDSNSPIFCLYFPNSLSQFSPSCLYLSCDAITNSSVCLFLSTNLSKSAKQAFNSWSFPKRILSC